MRQNRHIKRHARGWLALLLIAFACVSVTPQMAAAQSRCYVDYKAKRSQGGSLQLHYGVMQVGARVCANPSAAQRVVGKRLRAGGWTLLRVLSTFDANGLNQRQGNAGQYFLRY